VRVAFADPPYLGQGKKRYAAHHDEAHIWDDPQTHRLLIERLESEYDGFALCASSTTLHDLLPMFSTTPRIASWVKPFAAFKPNVRIAYTWEPVLFREARRSSKEGAFVNRDHLSEPITMKKGLVGAKPERFCRWVLDLVGWVPGDEVDDLFPGTGVMGRVVAAADASPLILRDRSGWRETL
jgi:hypothetical protein